MARLEFSLSNGVEGTIQLRDGMFMDFWKYAHKRNKRVFGVRKDKNVRSGFVYTDSSRWETVKREYYEASTTERNQYITLVNTAIDNLKALGYTWSRGYMPDNPTEEHCNWIHRGFTTYMLTGCTDTLNYTHKQKLELIYGMFNLNNINRYWLIRSIDPSLRDWIHQDNDAFGGANHFHNTAMWELHAINTYTHRIEDSSIMNTRSFEQFNSFVDNTLTPKLGKKIFGMTLPNLDWNSKTSDGCTDSSRCDWNFSEIRLEDPDMYDNSPQYNVYDLKNILGKDYEKCWYDGDDPTEWDICNTFNTTKGGFEIRPHQHHLTQNFIRPFVESHGIHYDDRWIAPISIGTISDSWLEQHCYFMDPETYETHHKYSITEVELIE